jgi:hypothetical protein
MAVYTFHENAPDQQTLRVTLRWQAWASAQPVPPAAAETQSP